MRPDRGAAAAPDKPVFHGQGRPHAAGETPVPRDILGSALDAATKGDKDMRIFLRADRTVPFGEMMEVMNLMRRAGFLKVALVGLEKPPPQ
jgi:biopolymer transport protein ExbD